MPVSIWRWQRKRTPCFAAVACSARAADGGEMGVMHALFQPQRETNLRIRLDEYLRFGLHAGLFYVT
jgi:hypothetical protein